MSELASTEAAVRAAAATGSADVPLRVVLIRRPVCLLALIFLALLCMVAALAELLPLQGPLTQNYLQALQGPSREHLLGTDALGRDILSRLVFGARVSIRSAAIATTVALLVGLPLGLLAGYVGRAADTVVARFTDVLLAVPGIIVLLAVITAFPGSSTVPMVALGVILAPSVIRLVRASVLSARHELYVDAAHSLGYRHRRIVLRHVLPNVINPIIVQASVIAGIALLVEAGLSFIGFGTEAPNPSWGNMIADASQVLNQDPWSMFPPGVAIVATVLALNVVADTLRDGASNRGRSRVPHRARRVEDTPPAEDAPPTEDTSGPRAEALLSVEHLTVSFVSPNQAKVDVVTDVSFVVRAGEILGLVGESGCGKSVTALAALGLLPPSGKARGGTVTFEGRDLLTTSARDRRQVLGRRIGWISQEPMIALDPMFTVASQVAEPLRVHLGLSRRQARLRTLELLAEVGLHDPRRVAASYPHQLSGGMAQRVAIAMAIGTEPSLLVADEPTTALDATVQREILELLSHLQAENDMAILLITHDFGVVSEFCARTVVMYAGQVVEQGPTDAIFDAALHPYAEALIGSNLQITVPGERLRAIRGELPSPGTWPDGCRFADRCDYVTAECRAKSVALHHATPGRAARCIFAESRLRRRDPDTIRG